MKGGEGRSGGKRKEGNREEEGALFKCVDVVRDGMVERKQAA